MMRLFTSFGVRSAGKLKRSYSQKRSTESIPTSPVTSLSPEDVIYKSPSTGDLPEDRERKQKRPSFRASLRRLRKSKTTKRSMKRKRVKSKHGFICFMFDSMEGTYRRGGVGTYD